MQQTVETAQRVVTVALMGIDASGVAATSCRVKVDLAGFVAAVTIELDRKTSDDSDNDSGKKRLCL